MVNNLSLLQSCSSEKNIKYSGSSACTKMTTNLIISILLTDSSKHKNTAMQYVQAETRKYTSTTCPNNFHLFHIWKTATISISKIYTERHV